jgi:hypothetical protein
VVLDIVDALVLSRQRSRSAADLLLTGEPPLSAGRLADSGEGTYLAAARELNEEGFPTGLPARAGTKPQIPPMLTLGPTAKASARLEH